MSRALAGLRQFALPPLFASSLVCLTGAAMDSGAQVANYYYSRYAYREALPLWQDVARRQPSDVTAALRVAELKLVLEGRDAACDSLKEFITREARSLSGESLRLVEQRMKELREVFLSDEGQTLYFQALAFVRRQDCVGALPILQQAQVLEKGNARLAREKADCQRSLERYAPYFESLIGLYESNPFAREVQVDLAEASLHFRQPERVVAIFENRVGDPLRSPKARLLYGVALLEQGKYGSAQVLLEPFVGKGKGRDISPVALFAMGKILAQRSAGRATALQFLDRFVLAAKPANGGWDPFHIDEKVAESRTLLAELKKTPYSP